MRTALGQNSTLVLPIGTGTRAYIIDDMIGSGATCIVYSAHYKDHAGQRHRVHIKECYPYSAQITRSGNQICWAEENERDYALTKFRSTYQKLLEMQNTQGLRNATAHAFELCEANGTLYSVMNVNEGKTFEQDISSSLSDILKTVLALTRVVGKYHENGYLHLDIKPSNFLTIPETRELVILFDMDSVTSINYFDENNTHAYFNEVVDTLQRTKQPYYLYIRPMMAAWNYFGSSCSTVPAVLQWFQAASH